MVTVQLNNNTNIHATQHTLYKWETRYCRSSPSETRTAVSRETNPADFETHFYTFKEMLYRVSLHPCPPARSTVSITQGTSALPTNSMRPFHRWWVICTALIETLLFSGALLGWNSLLPMLQSEGVYQHLCDEPALNQTPHVLKAGLQYPVLEEQSWDTAKGEVPDFGSDLQNNQSQQGASTIMPVRPHFCTAQGRTLNLVFTISSFCLGFTILPLQIILYVVRVQQIRKIGCSAFAVSCLLLTFVSSKPQSLSSFLMLAMACKGIGGACIMFSSLMVPPVCNCNTLHRKLPSLLGDIGPLYSALVLACYTASASMYTLIRVLYLLETPFIPLMLSYGALSCFAFINSYFSWSFQSSDGAVSEQGGYSIKIKLKFFSHVYHKPLHRDSSQRALSRRYMGSLRDKERLLMPHEKRTLTFQKQGTQKVTQSLGRSFISPVFLLSLFTCSVTQLWLHFYMGSLNNTLHYLAAGKERQDDLYFSVFGALQMLSLLSTPVMSVILGSHRHKVIYHNTEESSCPMKKAAHLRNLIVSFTLQNLFLTAFGVVCLVPQLGLQVLGFILHTIVRSSSFLSYCALYTVLYPAAHFGNLMGVYVLTSTIFSLLQHPLYLATISYLHNNPFWVHLGFLIAAFPGFMIPLYLCVRRSSIVRHSDTLAPAARM
ncbi:large neutral amino acids transporter small subunit 4-like [Protopterus annectens]|uniref:large neutral amino acids transporter small subunit 4-like n=1 Tax=Protopterus annectens TaxID=7888 RepID=UPI001CF968CA|nr:large neutral amino acids transporter small subunit 4-like [Protopterus annectens]